MNSGWPKPRSFSIVGDGIRMEAEVTGGKPARARRLRRNLVVDGERTYHAYSADELLEIENQASHYRRPGLPY